MGSGGAPEGVITAAAIRCLNGYMLGRLVVKPDQEERLARIDVYKRQRHSRAHRSHEISGHRPPSTGTSATPVYIGVFAVLLGEAATLHSMRLLGYAAFLCIPVQLFVIYDEQPTLRRQFGDSYEPYRRSVPRWIPRL